MKFLKFFRNFFNVYFAIIILLLVFVAPFLGFTYKRLWSNYNIIFLIVAFTFAIIIIKILNELFSKKIKLKQIVYSDNFFWIFLGVCSIILLILQIFIINGGWFIIGWDTRDVIFPEKQMNFDYMSMYPNQLMLAGIFRRLYFFLTNTLSFTFEEYYFTLCCISVILVWITVILIALISKKIINNFCGIISYILALVFLGLSPWIIIPYSDIFALFCTTFILCLYVYNIWNPVKWFLITFISIIGIAIKPTVAAIVFSIIFIEIISWIFSKVHKNKTIDTNGYLINDKKSFLEKFIRKFFFLPVQTKIQKKSTLNKKNYLYTSISVIMIILAVFSSSAIVNKTCNYGVTIDENRSFTFTHFLMMGINIENNAAWNNDDVSITRSYSNTKERSIGNLKQYAFRFKVLWPDGVLKIYINKTLTNFSDGTFCWAAEKPWAIEWKGNNKFIHWFYGYTDDKIQDDYSQYFAYIWQPIWFFIIVGCILTIINQKPNKKEIVICCSILALSAFLTLCEPDSRYVILYLSYFCIQATKGWYLLAKSIQIKYKLKAEY